MEVTIRAATMAVTTLGVPTVVVITRAATTLGVIMMEETTRVATMASETGMRGGVMPAIAVTALTTIRTSHTMARGDNVSEIHCVVATVVPAAIGSHGSESYTIRRSYSVSLSDLGRVAAPPKGLPAEKAEGIKPGLVARVRFLRGEEKLRVRLRIGSVADPAQEKASHGDVYHGFGDVDPLLVVAHQAAPAGEPAEGSFDDPAPG